LPVWRLHKLAGQEVVNCRNSTSFGMAPCAALHRGEPLRCQENRHLLHKKARINQNVWSIGENRSAPVIETSRALHEPVTQARGDFGFLIARVANMIADYLEALAIKLGDPAFN